MEGINEATRRILEFLGSNKLPEIDTKITATQVKAGYKKWRESTSTSPSGLHLGHAKTLVKCPKKIKPTVTNAEEDDESVKEEPSIADRLFEMEAQRANIALQQGFVLDRWKTIVSAMIEKIPGTPRIDKLRIIHIFEADLNLLKGIIWGRRLIKHAEIFGALGDEAWGSRGGRGAEECLLLKNFTYILMRLTRTPGGAFDNDAKACYDRIVMVLAMLRARHLGVPTKACKMLTSFLEEAAYQIKTTIGISDEKYSSRPDNYLHGPGQGARESPALWLIISTMLMQLLHQKSDGISFQDPEQIMETMRRMDAFVDDTTAWVNFFLESFDNNIATIDKIAVSLQQTAQWWEELLTATGGKLELDKCFYYIINWTFNKRGDAFIGPHKDIPIYIKDHTTNQLAKITQRPTDPKHKDTPHKTLGGMQSPCPSKGNQAQFEHLDKKLKKFANLVGAGWANRCEGIMLHQQYYTPSVKYGLCAAVMTESQLDKLQSQVIKVLLPKMGYCRSTPEEIRHGPMEVGGIGMLNLVTVHCTTKIESLIQQIRLGRPLGFKMLIALDWTQLHAGTRTKVMEETKYIPYIIEPWIDSVHAYMVDNNIKLKIPTTKIQPLRRDNDKYLMEEAINMGLSVRDLRDINNCRMFLKVTTLAEITNCEGTHILKQSFQCTGTNSKSTFLWPIQEQPTAAFNTWRNFLSMFTTSNRRLKQKLGKWTNLKGRKWCTYYHEKDRLVYIKKPDNSWDVHELPLEGSKRRYNIIQNDTINNVRQLPKDHLIPVHLKRKKNRLTVSIPCGIRHPPRNTSPDPTEATSWQDFVCSLPEWEQDLLRDNTDAHNLTFEIENELPQMTDLLSTLANGDTLYLVTDGGAIEPKRGSFGWVLATKTKVLWTGKGFTRGYPINSHRAEAYGRLAGTLFLLRFLQFSGLHECNIQLISYCDNKSIVESIAEAQDPFYKPGLTVSPDWDAIAQIHEIQNELRHIINVKDCQHVKGHQDKHKPLEELSWQAKLNYLADKGASAILESYQDDEENKWFPLPVCRAYIHIIDKVQTSTIIRSIEDRINELPLHEYLKDKHKWTDRELYDIDWDAYKGARRQFPKLQRSYTTKLCCKWLPTATRVALYNNSSDQCVLCNQPESQTHIFLCQHDTRQKWRHQTITNLDKFLTKQNTAPAIKDRIKNGLDAWLHGRPTNVQNDPQSSIGWESFFYGYIAAEWGHEQQRYLHKNKKSDKDSAYTWAMKLIQFLWQQSHIIWLQRNNDVHGDSEDSKQSTLKSCEARLRAVYSLQDEVSYYDKQIFSKSIDEMLRLPIRQIHKWLKTYEPYMIERHRIFIHQLHTRNKAITEYFQIKNTRPPSNRPKHTSRTKQKTHTQTSLTPNENPEIIQKRKQRKTRIPKQKPFTNTKHQKQTTLS